MPQPANGSSKPTKARLQPVFLYCVAEFEPFSVWTGNAGRSANLLISLLVLTLRIDFFGVGDNPIQSLFFGREAFDATLMAGMISDHNMPARSLLVLKGQHDRFFF